MKKFISGIALLISFLGFAQEKEAVNSPTWYISTGTGLTQALSGFHQDEISDILINQKNTSFNWQLLSVDVKIYKNFGIHYSLNTHITDQGYVREYTIADIIRKNNPGLYILQTNVDTDLFDNEFDRRLTKLTGSLGLSYFQNHEKFFIIYRLDISKYQLDINRYNILLKQQNSNSYYKISYTPNTSKINKFILVPSVGFGYKLSEKWALKTDLDYILTQPDIQFERQKTDLYTGEILDQKIINYDIYKQQIRLNLGFTFMF